MTISSVASRAENWAFHRNWSVTAHVMKYAKMSRTCGDARSRGEAL